MSTCKCPHCGGEINPASLLGKGKKKTMTQAAIEARQRNGKLGGKKKPEAAIDAYFAGKEGK